MSLPLLRRLAAWAVLVWITVSMQLGGTGHYQLAAWWLIAGAAAMVIGGVLVDSRYPLDEPLEEPEPWHDPELDALLAARAEARACRVRQLRARYLAEHPECIRPGRSA